MLGGQSLCTGLAQKSVSESSIAAQCYKCLSLGVGTEDRLSNGNFRHPSVGIPDGLVLTIPESRHTHEEVACVHSAHVRRAHHIPWHERL